VEFDHRRLRLGEQIAGASAVLLFIDMFLAWYSGVDVSANVLGRSVSRTVGGDVSAWSAFGLLDLFLLLVILVTLALVVLKATQRSPALPVAASVIVTALGALAFLLVLFRVIDPPNADYGFGSASANVTYGIFLGLILTAGIAYGGFRSMKEEGTSFADAKAQAQDAVSSRGRSVPASGGTGAPPSTTSTPPATPPPVAPPSPPPPGAPPGGTAPPAAPTPPPATPPAEEPPGGGGAA
jgi:hypothetical protein